MPTEPTEERNYHETGSGMATLGDMFKNLQRTTESSEGEE